MGLASKLAAFAARLTSDSKVPQAALAANVAGNGPAFSAYPNVALSVSANTETKVVLPNERFDTANCFDAANSKFTPNVAGYYWVMGLVSTGANTWGTNPQIICMIKKNGGNIALNQAVPNSQWISATVAQLVYMNGTTDYLELYAQASTAVNFVQYGAYTEFSAFLARAA